MSKKITALIPGAALALGIACIAKWLETLESSAGLHLIGASVIALFIDPAFISLSGVIAVVSATLASLIPARRSARLDPMEVIRNG